MPKPPTRCPCDPDHTYSACCQPFHEGALAPTPEALMRSRYSAYVVGQLDYLLRTWHTSSAPGDLELSPTQWQSLEIVHTESTQEAGVVEFIARYKINGKAHRMHETSRFVREQGAWYYVDGIVAED